MICSNCGYEYNEQRCPRCGAFNGNFPQPPVAPALNNNNPYNQPYTYKRTSKGVAAAIIIGAAVVFAGIVVAAPIGLFALFDFTENTTQSVVSKNAEVHSSSESALIGDIEYSIDDISFSDTFKGDKPSDGCEFMRIKLRAKNTASFTRGVYPDFSLYVNDVLYDEYDDGFYGDDILGGKTMIGDCVYEVPKLRNKLEFCVSDSDIFGKTVKFDINEKR